MTKIKVLNEWKRPSEEVYALADKIKDLSIRTVKDPNTRGPAGHIIRELTVAFGLAEALKKDHVLYSQAKDNYEELYLVLENQNFHFENLGLDLLFNKKQFKEMVDIDLDFRMKDF